MSTIRTQFEALMAVISGNGRASYEDSAMSIFHVTVTNCTFRTSSEPTDFIGAEAALQDGIKSAVAIATDELNDGSTSTVIEVCVADSNHVAIFRSVVSLSVCPLMVN
jgi:hypothetical protein